MIKKGFSIQSILLNLAVLISYASTGYLGLMLAVPPGYATAIWPPSGIGLGFVLVWGLRTLPGIFLGSFILNYYVTFNNVANSFDSLNIITGLITGSGALLQAFLGWFLVKFFVKLDNPLHLPKDILIFALLTGPISCIISPTIGNIGLYIIGVISSDIFAKSWITWWIGDSIGVLIFTPVFLISFAKPEKIWRARIVPILLPLCTTFFIVFLAHICFSNSELKRVQSKFEDITRNKLDQLTDELKLTAETAKTISLFLATEPLNTKEEFQYQGRLMLHDNPFLKTILWAPKIENANEFKKKFSIDIMKEKDIGYSSWAHKLWYEPILFSVSKSDPMFALGYDASSNPNFVYSLNQSIQQKNPVFSIFLTKDGKASNVFIVSAINRHSQLAGLSLMHLDFTKLSHHIFNNYLNYSNLSIKKNSNLSTSTPIFEIYKKEISPNQAKLFHTVFKYQFAGSTWDIEATSSDYFINHEYSWQVWSALTETLFFCVLMNIILFILYGQRYLIQYLADAKAVQLQTEQAKNMLLLNAAGEGIVWIDMNYRVSFINPAAEKLLGYTNEELKNKLFITILHENTNNKSYEIEKTTVYRAIREKTVIKNKETVFWKQRGEHFWVEYTCIPIIINEEVKGAAIIFGDITERLENEMKLMKMAHFDPLTKLPNRLSFFEYLEHALARAHRANTSFGVCFIDVDNFKFINDNYGHVYGDKILTKLPELIIPLLRDTDYFARIGGDEFGMIFEETWKLNDVTKIFERILAMLDTPIQIDDQLIKTSISIGVALYPQNGNDAETLFKNADLAMYHAKEMGKSTFSFY